MATRATPEKALDVTKICGVISRISTDLNSVSGIKAKLTSIGNTAERIDDDIRTMEINIRKSLDELQQLLNVPSSR
jgi:hypothetical protein